MKSKLKKYIISELNKSEKHANKLFEYLKEVEKNEKYDLKLQKAIYYICEIDEIISSIIISLEGLDEQL
jgi:hypothetical protein